MGLIVNNNKVQAPFGTWQSEITPEMVSSSSTRYASVAIDGRDIYWLEGRPQEKGRTVIVRLHDGERQDVLPTPYNVRSRVHEYGGGGMAVKGGQIWFVNDANQQIYHIVDISHGEEGVWQVTKADGCRFADLVIDDEHDCLYAVREHTLDETRIEPVNDLVRIDRKSGEVTVIASGDDFYSAPALSSDGQHIAWLSWVHPNMPWDETILWLADIQADGSLTNIRQVVAQDNHSVFQPSWSPDGRLYFVNDPTGWWQLYRLNDLQDMSSIEQVCDYEAEMGLPLWQFGMRTYAFENEYRVIATICEDGLWRLVKICTNTGEIEPIETPYNTFSSMAGNDELVVVIAAGFSCIDEVVRIELQSAERSCINEIQDTGLDAGWFSQAEPISFPTTNDDIAHGFYYAPSNPGYEAIPGKYPPLLVMTHGGPTGATSASLNLRTQFWTSRGFAVLDMNYRGSTGYGREYREKLIGRWGIYDVDDVVAGARYLVKQRLVDRKRMAIRGGSAGGYTTLAALTFSDVFTAGCSHYGIGDLESLAMATHKFEARYMDSLVGEYPKEKETYIQRSPLYHVGQLSCPVIFMQGTEDKVVPPEQAQSMADALKEKGIDVELLMFEGEQHGFRRADTIQQALLSELAFYERVYQLQV